MVSYQVDWSKMRSMHVLPPFIDCDLGRTES